MPANSPAWFNRPQLKSRPPQSKKKNRYAKTGTPATLPLTPRRKWLFRFVAASLPFVFLLLAEIAFRIIPGLSEDRDPYVNISPVSIFSRTVIGGKEYFNIVHRYVGGSRTDQILVKKPSNTIRIFCLGASA